MQIETDAQVVTQSNDLNADLLNRLLWIQECREYALFLADLFDSTGQTELATRIASCRNKLQIEIFAKTFKITYFKTCGIRVCPFCSKRWASRKARYYEPHIRQYGAQGHRLQYLTLTLVSVPVLEQSLLDKLWKCWINLRRRKLFKGYIATLGCMEVGHNENGWHPHLHIILVGGESLSEDAVSPIWSELTDGSFQVNVRPLNNSEIHSVIKYSLKIPRVQYDQDLRQLYDSLNAFNLIRPSGKLFKLNKHATNVRHYPYRGAEPPIKDEQPISSVVANSDALDDLIRTLDGLVDMFFLDDE
jgi:hypothetical protein